VHLALAAADSKEALRRELSDSGFKDIREPHPAVFSYEVESKAPALLPYLAFARQLLLDAHEVSAPSIRAWASLLVGAVAGVLPDQQLWSLHVYPLKQQSTSPRMGARAWHTRARAGQRVLLAKPPAAQDSEERGAPQAGDNRCRLIRDAAMELLHERRRHLARYIREQPLPFDESESLVQLALTSPEHGFLSVALAPQPFRQRHVLSCFRGGHVAPTRDRQAPSRAFGKLVEAEARMGRRISARDSCVDLGASPGSWTYVAARRGAKVTAVDRAELRADLMHDKNVLFRRSDAFQFRPEGPVDWLLCDVIGAAERTAELLLSWVRERWCRHFIVTLKVDDGGSPVVLSHLKRVLPELTSELWLLRLCANKKEVTAFGTIVAP
jgi:23S rRNA (cytidine2498-2'-O)-methyltransferase